MGIHLWTPWTVLPIEQLFRCCIRRQSIDHVLPANTLVCKHLVSSHLYTTNQLLSLHLIYTHSISSLKNKPCGTWSLNSLPSAASQVSIMRRDHIYHALIVLYTHTTEFSLIRNFAHDSLARQSQSTASSMTYFIVKHHLCQVRDKRYARMVAR